MADWVRVAPLSEIDEGKTYFLGKPPVHKDGIWFFYARDIKGKTVMSQKPGIAIRFEGGAKLKDVLANHDDLRAVNVPGDADKRWARRKRLFKEAQFR